MSGGTLPVPLCNHGSFPLQQLDQCDGGGGDDGEVGVKTPRTCNGCLPGTRFNR